MPSFFLRGQLTPCRCLRTIAYESVERRALWRAVFALVFDKWGGKSGFGSGRWSAGSGTGSSQSRATAAAPIEFFESGWLAAGTNSRNGRAGGRKAVGSSQYILKGLILAQNERWRRGLGMQVAGIPAMGEPA